jgi:hypothetical protein
MATKRFFDTSILPKNWRKFSNEIKLTYFYLWNNCDESGVWETDNDLFEFDNGFKLHSSFIQALELLIMATKSKVLVIDFIRVNYPTLTENYNPHKPCFRAINKNQIIINPSSSQACFKLVDVDEEEDVYEDVIITAKKEKKILIPKQELSFENTFSESFIPVWKKWNTYKKEQFNFKYKSFDSEKVAIMELYNLSGKNEKDAEKIINQSIANGWKGFFKLKNDNNQQAKNNGINHNTLLDNF